MLLQDMLLCVDRGNIGRGIMPVFTFEVWYKNKLLETVEKVAETEDEAYVDVIDEAMGELRVEIQEEE